MPSGVYKHKSGQKCSKKAKIKMSENHADFSGEKNPNFGNEGYWKGKHFSDEHRKKIKQALLSPNRKRKYTPLTEEHKEKIRKSDHKHHINMDVYNNSLKNILYLPKNFHHRLHLRAYDFLVEEKLVYKYFRWFKKTFGIDLIQYRMDNDKQKEKGTN